VRDTALRLDLQAIHLPDIDLAATVLPPENVAVAVAVEIVDALDVPIASDRSVRDSALRLNLSAGLVRRQMKFRSLKMCQSVVTGACATGPSA
jgi:hypothetical protein